MNINKFDIDFNFSDINEIAIKINNFINLNNCEQMQMDLSALNLIDAMKIAVLSSTRHFLKYPIGKICFELKDEAARKLIAPLKLKNTILKVKENTDIMILRKI